MHDRPILTASVWHDGHSYTAHVFHVTGGRGHHKYAHLSVRISHTLWRRPRQYEWDDRLCCSPDALDPRLRRTLEHEIRGRLRLISSQ